MTDFKRPFHNPSIFRVPRTAVDVSVWFRQLAAEGSSTEQLLALAADVVRAAGGALAPEVMCVLGQLLQGRGRHTSALKYFDLAASWNKSCERQQASAASEARALAQALRARVPVWHFEMLNDRARNECFDAAIRQAVAACQGENIQRTADADADAMNKRYTRVADLGAGTGLLSLMALRAGADSVLAIERNSLVVEVGKTVCSADVETANGPPPLRWFERDLNLLRTGEGSVSGDVDTDDYDSVGAPIQLLLAELMLYNLILLAKQL